MTKNTMRRRPLCSMAAAVLMALPSAGLVTSHKSPSRLSMAPTGEDFQFSSASSSTTPTSSTESPTPLKMMVDEQEAFEINLGKAVDTLKQDYPDILTDDPDFCIYSNDLEVVDPAGVKLHGLKSYRNAFKLVHTIINLFYCPERSLLTFRLVYDWARNEIRVSWNTEVVPKAIFGGTKTTLHVDGISVYVLNRESGKIVQHRIEHLMINDSPVAPERGIIHDLQKEVPEGIGIPSFIDTVAKFQSWNNPLQKRTSLFSMESSMDKDIDWEKLERKNASRKKFGLDPLTPEEFKEIEAQVEQMERKAATAASSSSSTMTKDKKESGFLNKLFGNVLEDTCESNFDCQRPQVCCDFGFTKKCCTSGQKVVDGGPRFGDKATVPVTAGYPPGLGPDSDPRIF